MSLRALERHGVALAVDPVSQMLTFTTEELRGVSIGSKKPKKQKTESQGSITDTEPDSQETRQESDDGETQPPEGANHRANPGTLASEAMQEFHLEHEKTQRWWEAYEAREAERRAREAERRAQAAYNSPLAQLKRELEDAKRRSDAANLQLEQELAKGQLLQEQREREREERRKQEAEQEAAKPSVFWNAWRREMAKYADAVRQAAEDAEEKALHRQKETTERLEKRKREWKEAEKRKNEEYARELNEEFERQRLLAEAEREAHLAARERATLRRAQQTEERELLQEKIRERDALRVQTEEAERMRQEAARARIAAEVAIRQAEEASQKATSAKAAESEADAQEALDSAQEAAAEAEASAAAMDDDKGPLPAEEESSPPTPPDKWGTYDDNPIVKERGGDVDGGMAMGASQEEESESQFQMDMHEVEKIVDCKLVGEGRSGYWMYRIRWRGRRAKRDEWVPEKNLDAPEKVRAYENWFKKTNAIPGETSRVPEDVDLDDYADDAPAAPAPMDDDDASAKDPEELGGEEAGDADVDGLDKEDAEEEEEEQEKTPDDDDDDDDDDEDPKGGPPGGGGGDDGPSGGGGDAAGNGPSVMVFDTYDARFKTSIYDIVKSYRVEPAWLIPLLEELVVTALWRTECYFMTDGELKQSYLDDMSNDLADIKGEDAYEADFQKFDKSVLADLDDEEREAYGIDDYINTRKEDFRVDARLSNDDRKKRIAKVRSRLEGLLAALDLIKKGGPGDGDDADVREGDSAYNKGYLGVIKSWRNSGRWWIWYTTPAIRIHKQKELMRYRGPRTKEWLDWWRETLFPGGGRPDKATDGLGSAYTGEIEPVVDRTTVPVEHAVPVSWYTRSKVLIENGDPEEDAFTIVLATKTENSRKSNNPVEFEDKKGKKLAKAELIYQPGTVFTEDRKAIVARRIIYSFLTYFMVAEGGYSGWTPIDSRTGCTYYNSIFATLLRLATSRQSTGLERRNMFVCWFKVTSCQWHNPLILRASGVNSILGTTSRNPLAKRYRELLLLRLRGSSKVPVAMAQALKPRVRDLQTVAREYT